MTPHFEDIRLELAAREALDLAGLDERGWEQLRSLRVPRRDIRRLRGIEALGGLRWIDLARNPVVSLEPLATLAQLRGLSLAKTSVASLRALGGLPVLEHLDLRDTGVRRLDELVGAQALRSLDLTDCPIVGLSGLESFDRLASLTVGNRSVADDPDFGLEPVFELSSLSELCLRRVRLASLDHLAGLVRLESLRLHGCNISDRLTSLPTLPRLRYLSVAGSELTQAGWAAGFASLETLDLSGTKIRDLRPLRALQSLRVLILDDTELRARDVAALQGMPHLAEVRLPTPSRSRYIGF